VIDKVVPKYSLSLLCRGEGGKVRSVTGSTFHSQEILVKQKYWVKVLVVLNKFVTS